MISKASYLLRIVGLLLIVAVLLLLVNKSIFVHSHKMADGTIVVHAHPYNKSNDTEPFKSHTHTQAELLFFQQFQNFLPFIILAFAVILLVHKFLYAAFNLLHTAQVSSYIKRGRAPPVL